MSEDKIREHKHCKECSCVMEAPVVAVTLSSRIKGNV